MRLVLLGAVLCLAILGCRANPIQTITVPDEARSLTDQEAVQKRGEIQEAQTGVFKTEEKPEEKKEEVKPEEAKPEEPVAVEETQAVVKEEKRPKQKIKVTGRQSSDDEDDDDDDDDDIGLGDDDDDDDDDEEETAAGTLDSC